MTGGDLQGLFVVEEIPDNDRLLGEAGDDVILGDAGDDQLNGGDGENDLCEGGDDTNRLNNCEGGASRE